MRRCAAAGPLAILLVLAVAAPASAATASFGYTGAEQTFTVPAGVSSVHVVAVGGAGSGTIRGSAAGGLGALVGGDLSVAGGQTLYVEVGGSGSTSGPGFNGGGAGGESSNGGGGASDVRGLPLSAAGSLQSRRLVAGGGGGGGNGSTDRGAGGAAGQAGKAATFAAGGGPGTATMGGGGGGGADSNGALGVGGAGKYASDFKTSSGAEFGSGGGGGGGYYGGGGGAAIANSADGGAGVGEGGGGGGGSSLVVAGGSLSTTSAVPSVTITYTLAAAGGAGGNPAALATVSGLSFSSTTFAAESSGPPATNARHKATRGTKVSYSLNEAATARFTINRRTKGRRVKHGKRRVCAKPTRKNHKRRRCTRVVTLKGSFSRNGVAGKNSFHFTGRLNGRKLKPGRYRLVATPSAGGTNGKPTSSAFRIVR